jgi:hypothetical protein
MIFKEFDDINQLYNLDNKQIKFSKKKINIESYEPLQEVYISLNGKINMTYLGVIKKYYKISDTDYFIIFLFTPLLYYYESPRICKKFRRIIFFVDSNKNIIKTKIITNEFVVYRNMYNIKQNKNEIVESVYTPKSKLDLFTYLPKIIEEFDMTLLINHFEKYKWHHDISFVFS